MRRLRSGWRWGWALGFALLCVYIAFDVLDLDGSQLHWRSEVAITAETCSAEADRIVKATSPAPSDRPLHAVLTDQTALWLHPAAAQPSLVRNQRLLPRRHLSRLDSHLPGSSDPA